MKKLAPVFGLGVSYPNPAGRRGRLLRVLSSQTHLSSRWHIGPAPPVQYAIHVKFVKKVLTNVFGKQNVFIFTNIIKNIQ